MRATLPSLVVMVLAAAAGPIVGQATPAAPVPATLVAVAAGVGAGSPDVGGHLSLTVSRGAGDLIVRHAGASEFEFFGFSESASDVAVLYGIRGRRDRGWTRGAIGLGHVRHVHEGEREGAECVFFCSYEEVTSTTMGLAIQLDAVWAPWRGFGLGVTGLGNLNGRRSFGALMLTFHLGRVR